MSLNGNWKKTSTEGEVEFGKAIGWGGASEDEWKAQCAIAVEVSYKVEGDNIESTRTYGGAKSITNKGVFNVESDYNFLGHDMKVKITGKDGDVVLESVSGWATVTVKVDGDKMVENVKHNESGATLVNTWARA